MSKLRCHLGTGVCRLKQHYSMNRPLIFHVIFGYGTKVHVIFTETTHIQVTLSTQTSIVYIFTGHYWAYVHCPEHGGWMKFNDITVSEASWEELEKESIGGYHNASAYCLMYIDAKKCDSLLGMFK